MQDHVTARSLFNRVPIVCFYPKQIMQLEAQIELECCTHFLEVMYVCNPYLQ